MRAEDDFSKFLRLCSEGVLRFGHGVLCVFFQAGNGHVGWPLGINCFCFRATAILSFTESDQATSKLIAKSERPEHFSRGHPQLSLNPFFGQILGEKQRGGVVQPSSTITIMIRPRKWVRVQQIFQIWSNR